MKAVQAHFRELGREPTDVELETIAQTWSEHCSHKTLKGPIDFTDTIDGETRHLQEPAQGNVFAATQEIRQQARGGRLVRQRVRGQRRRGEVRRRATTSASRSRRTTTRRRSNLTAGRTPASAASSATCSAPAWRQAGLQHRRVLLRPARLPRPSNCPPGVLHPRRVMHGVVAGVRDYGNRMGIPTVNGAICFDDRYLGQPARLLRHRRPDPGGQGVQGGRSPAT